jgi:hypothetical protein
LTLGIFSRCDSHHKAFLRGQQLGNGLSLGLGAMEFIIGEGMRGGGEVMLVTSGGTLVPIATGINTAGTAISTHGTVVMGKALLEFSGENKHEGGNKYKGQKKYEGQKQSGRNDRHASKVLQSGGQKLKPRVLKALNLTKDQGRDAIHALKDHKGLPNNFHGKIMSNGDYLHPSTGERLGNLLEYTY